MDSDTQTARVTLTLSDDYNSLVLGNEEAFAAHIKSELATEMSITEDRIINLDVSAGRRYSPIISVHFVSWWRHQMETFSTLLDLCAGNSPVTGELPSQRLVTRSFDVWRHYNVLLFTMLIVYILQTNRIKYSTLWDIKAKWPPFSRRHFQIHFH